MPLSIPVQMPEQQYIFIDGGALDAIANDFSREFYDGASIDIDYSKIRSGFRKAFYYHAVPVDKKPSEREEDFIERQATAIDRFRAIDRLDGFHVRTGDARHQRRTGQEQKMVDVLLAVEMMSLAHRGTFSKATIITNDLDFKPLLDALVVMGIDLTLIHKPSANEELISAADRAQPVALYTLFQWTTHSFQKRFPFPEAVQGPVSYLAGDIARWTDPNTERGHCRLYGEPRDYLLVSQYSGHSGHGLSIKFSDIATSRKIIASQWGITIPEHIQ